MLSILDKLSKAFVEGFFVKLVHEPEAGAGVNKVKLLVVSNSLRSDLLLL